MADFKGTPGGMPHKRDVVYRDDGDGTYTEAQAAQLWVWDTGLLAWRKLTPADLTGSGGGGAVTVADGADVAQGSRADVAWVSGSGTVISLLKKIASAGGSAVSVADGSDVAEGATADAAWSGSGSGSVVAVLKAIYGKVAGVIGVSQSGTWTVQPGNTANTTAWKVDGSSVTQPVSAVSLPLPTNAATSALQTQPGVDIGDVTINNASGASAVNIQDGGNSITVDGAVAVSGSVTATGPLTDTQLRASAVPVSGTFWQTTQPVSGTVAATQGTSPWVTQDSRLPTALGSSLSTASLPVVIASDQAAVTGIAREQGGQLQQVAELLQQLLIEVRIHSLLLQQGLNVRDEPESMRSDPSFAYLQ